MTLDRIDRDRVYAGAPMNDCTRCHQAKPESGLCFTALREVTLKGISEPQQLYSVEWD